MCIRDRHYSISIIIGKGIDVNAINKILERHGSNVTLVFIDGWTGKGTISSELQKSLKDYNQYINYKFLVLSDIAGVADVSATREDYIIPSSLLNSTISGLISRTLINTDSKKYHGAKYFQNHSSKDRSLEYVNQIDNYIQRNNLQNNISNVFYFDPQKKYAAEQMVIEIQDKYDISSKSLLKPGIGETTRVLIRRNPAFVIINENYKHSLQHILFLCEIKNVKIFIENKMPFSSIGVINKFQS